MYRCISAIRCLPTFQANGFVRSFGKVVNSAKDKPARELKGATQATPAAEDRIRTLLKKKPEGTGLLLSTTTSNSYGIIVIVVEGCNGNKYVMKYCEPGQEGAFDEIIEQNGVKVVVDADSLMYILGTTIDYKEDDIAAEFVFDNPLAVSTCGCGESFSVK